MCSPGGYRYTVFCQAVITYTENTNEPYLEVNNGSGCQENCDDDPTCVAYSYSYETRICKTYSPLSSYYTTQRDVQGVYAIYEQGYCPLGPE